MTLAFAQSRCGQLKFADAARPSADIDFTKREAFGYHPDAMPHCRHALQIDFELCATDSRAIQMAHVQQMVYRCGANNVAKEILVLAVEQGSEVKRAIAPRDHE